MTNTSHTLREKITQLLDTTYGQHSKPTADQILSLFEEEIRKARVKEVNMAIEKLRAFMNGTSTNPAADTTLELEDRLKQLQHKETFKTPYSSVKRSTGIGTKGELDLKAPDLGEEES